MALGLGLLRLEPRTFWSMTPRELDCAARPLLGVAPRLADQPARADLAALLSRFPDAS
jgi:uncharacterized phage protein (TIGR02216 family)